MNADEFCRDYESRGVPARRIDDVLDDWATKEKQRLPEDLLGMEALVAVLVADAAVGDGLLNEISPELLQAFAARRGDSLDSYDEVRAYLQEMLGRGDHSVAGVVNQIKGQIGELAFKEQAGGHAYLAAKTNQEAWDVAIPHTHGATEYVQVKIYQSADHAIAMMQKVQAKVTAGTVSDGGSTVEHINFAVNKDIADAVRAKAALHPELAGIKVYDVPVTDHQATGIVTTGFENVGPEEMAHLFTEWFGGTLTTACINSMANAFMVYKGAKSVEAAAESTALSTALSAPGVAAAKGSAVALTKAKIAFLSGHPVIAAIAAGMLARAVAKSWYEARESTAEMLRRESRHLTVLTGAVGHRLAVRA